MCSQGWAGRLKNIVGLPSVGVGGVKNRTLVFFTSYLIKPEGRCVDSSSVIVKPGV